MSLEAAGWPIVATVAGVWLALAAWFIRIQRHTLTDMSQGRKRWALGIRLVILTLICFALAGVRLVYKNSALTVVFLVDGSKSISDEQKEQARQFVAESLRHKKPTDMAGVLSFGSDVDVKLLPVQMPAMPSGGHRGTANSTNLARAMETALPLIPNDSAGRVVVLSDGNENTGSALSQIPAVTARGIQVKTVVLPSPLQKEALIEKVVTPSEVKIGEPFQVKVITNALNQQPGHLSIRTKEGELSKAKTVTLAEGRKTQVFEATLHTPGFHRIEAQLETDSDLDTHTENNKGLAYVSVRGKPQILYIASTSHGAGYLTKALKTQNFDVTHTAPEAIPTNAADFLKYDSILISDVASSEFSASQLEALQVCTRDFGVGFGMVGGERSFGMGGYRKTPVEAILPVSMDLRKKMRFPPVCVALVIDRSGSMMEASKLEYAKDASVRAVNLLKPEDTLAVITFTESAEVQVPPTKVEKAAEITAGIQAISPGGGTSVYNGTNLAYQTIKDEEAPIKHIILLTDGMSSDPDYRPLVAEMKRKKITVSSVAIGGGGSVDASRLYWLAQETGGRFYKVDSPRDIPAIYMQEIERISSSPLVEEPFTPRILPGSEEKLAGLDSSMPPLLGYNVTEVKPTADHLMTSHRNDPIFATWRYGLGRAMAFTSDDKNRWAVQWLPWSGYAKFWAQAIRWTMRSFTPSDFQTQVTTDGSRGHVVVTAIDKDGKFVNRLNFKARVSSPEMDGSQPQELEVRQTGPGTYEGWFEAGQIGSYLVNVVREVPGKPAEMSVHGLSVPYSPEYRDLQANDYLLNQVAEAGGGKMTASAAEVFGGDRPIFYKPRDLTQWLLALAMLLFPIDIAIRRLALDKSDFRRFWSRESRVKSREGKTSLECGVESRENPDRKPATVSLETVSQLTREQLRQEEPNSRLAAEQPSTNDVTPSTESGMSRLMAAKQRAREMGKSDE